MKTSMKYLLLLLVSISLPMASKAQVTYLRGTGDVIQPELLTKRLKENKEWVKKNPKYFKSFDPIYVPVKFHLVAQADGTGRIDASMVIAEICDLNAQFVNTGITFYIKGEFNEFEDNSVYEVPRSSSSINRMRSEKDDFALNVFITQNADDIGVDNGTSLGFYHPTADVIVVRKSQVGNNSATLAHEIGHYFSLRHPHYGWEDQPWTEEHFGKKVLVTIVSSSQSGFQNVGVELVNQSNCETAADLLCDTPPDYNFGLLWPSSCPPFNLDVMDKNGDTIKPMINNFMSYFIGCEPYEFTEKQSQVMIADFNSSRRFPIRNSYIPNTQKITQTVALLSPNFNETVDATTPITLEWSDVNQAEQYYVIVKGNSQEWRYITTDTILILEGLEIDKTFSWTVHPYKETGGCAEKKTGLFKTTDMSTAVIDPVFVREIRLFPNPVRDQNMLNLQFYSTQSFKGKLDIYNFEGKLGRSKGVEVKENENLFNIDIQDLKAGLYILRLQMGSSALTRSFVKT